MTADIVFLVDVDNTLLDNDAIQGDLRAHLGYRFGIVARNRHREILAQLSRELGYRDYLGALQRYRVEHPHDLELQRKTAPTDAGIRPRIPGTTSISSACSPGLESLLVDDYIARGSAFGWPRQRSDAKAPSKFSIGHSRSRAWRSGMFGSIS